MRLDSHRADITSSSTVVAARPVVDRALRIATIRACALGRRTCEIPALARRFAREPGVLPETRRELIRRHEENALRRRVEPRRRVVRFLGPFEKPSMSEIHDRTIEIQQELLL